MAVELLRGGCLYGGAAASELELQFPDSAVVGIFGSELPVSGGIACEAGEIPAGPRVFQQLADDIARGINEHTDRDVDVAANLVLDDPVNVRDDPVKHRG